jgi:hypothetical protein
MAEVYCTRCGGRRVEEQSAEEHIRVHHKSVDEMSDVLPDRLKPGLPVQTFTPLTKFTMIRYRNEQKTVVTFSRSDDGMIVGVADDCLGVFGEDITQAMQRGFTSHECAVQWVKKKCREYAGREDVDFLTEEGTSQIVVPRGAVPRIRQQ